MSSNLPGATQSEELFELYRPVGLREMALIWDSGMREYPPIQDPQSYFNPLTSIEYARQIASEWNVKDEASVFSGYVTSFRVTQSYLSRLRSQRVEGSKYTEYRIPVEQLAEFNRAVRGAIVIEEAYFGPQFEGYVPAKGALKDKSAREQFLELAKVWEHSSIDFGNEISRNRKAVYLNAWFWAQQRFSGRGIRSEQKLLMFERLRNTWQLQEIEIPWPEEKLGQVLTKSVAEEAQTQGGVSRLWPNARSRAGGRVDDVVSDEQIDVQDELRQSLKTQHAKLPLTVGWLAVGLFLYAAYNVILFVLAMVHPELYRTGDSHRDSRIAFQVAFLGPLRAVGSAIFAVGLMRLERWARSRLLFFAALDLCRGVIALMLPGASTRMHTISGQIVIIFCVVVILCLTTEKARLAFEAAPQKWPA